MRHCGDSLSHPSKIKSGTKKAVCDEKQPDWDVRERLFGKLSDNFLYGLETLPRAIEEVWHIPPSRRKALPLDIRDLSRLLTRERAELNIPYWHRPANISAYLYYFLPWNIIRLGRLLASVKLPEPAQISGSLPVLMDMGSGPLALPIALWLAKKEWRDLPLQIFACDSASQPLELGKKLFAALANMLDQNSWTVHTRVLPAEKALNAFNSLHPKIKNETFYPWLIAETNILNELITKNPARNMGVHEVCEDTFTEDDCSRNSILGKLLNAWLPLWKIGAGKTLALFVEPGTRLGGDAIMNLRHCAIELGFQLISPCTHSSACPLMEKTRRYGSHADSWCHFTFAANPAPQWLNDLSREAGLEKSSLSLSYVLLSPESSIVDKSSVRLISQAFKVPGLKGLARYACGEKGLKLLENAENLVSGSLTLAKAMQPFQKDAKSGATICIPENVGKIKR